MEMPKLTLDAELSRRKREFLDVAERLRRSYDRLGLESREDRISEALGVLFDTRTTLTPREVHLVGEMQKIAREMLQAHRSYYGTGDLWLRNEITVTGFLTVLESSGEVGGEESDVCSHEWRNLVGVQGEACSLCAALRCIQCKKIEPTMRGAGLCFECYGARHPFRSGAKYRLGQEPPGYGMDGYRCAICNKAHGNGGYDCDDPGLEPEGTEGG